MHNHLGQYLLVQQSISFSLHTSLIDVCDGLSFAALERQDLRIVSVPESHFAAAGEGVLEAMMMIIGRLQ